MKETIQSTNLHLQCHHQLLTRTMYTLCLSFHFPAPTGQSDLLYHWKFLPNSTRSHWLPQAHMTSNNEAFSCQNR